MHTTWHIKKITWFSWYNFQQYTFDTIVLIAISCLGTDSKISDFVFIFTPEKKMEKNPKLRTAIFIPEIENCIN